MDTRAWYDSLDPLSQRYVKELMLHEAQNQGPWGMAAIPDVVKERALNTGRSVPSIANQPKQFSHFKLGGQNWTPQQLAEAEGSIGMHDQAGGRTHYYNPKLANPTWAKDMTNTVKIGDHLFGDLGTRAKDPFLARGGPVTEVAKSTPAPAPALPPTPGHVVRNVQTVNVTPNMLAEAPPPVAAGMLGTPAPEPPRLAPAPPPAQVKPLGMKPMRMSAPQEPDEIPTLPTQAPGLANQATGVPGISLLGPAPPVPPSIAAPPVATPVGGMLAAGPVGGGGFPVNVNSMIGGGPPAGGYGAVGGGGGGGGFNFLEAIGKMFGGG